MTGRRASRCSRKCVFRQRPTRRCPGSAAPSITRTNSSAASPTIRLRSSAIRSAVIRLSAPINRALLRTPFPLPAAAPGQLGFLASNLDTEYLGVYGQSTWNLSEQFLITGGARWQEESKEANIRQWVNDPAPSIISMLLSPAAVSAEGLEHDASEVTWSVTPQWRVTDNTMLFATAAHGFKSGGFNTGFGRLPIAAARVRGRGHHALRGGRKVRAAEPAACGSQRAYSTRSTTTTRTPPSSAGNSRSTTPSRRRLEGAELEGALMIGERLTADFAVSYADLVYEKNTHGQCYPGRASDSTTTPGACDLSGEHPVNAPEWKTHLGLQYEQPVELGRSLRACGLVMDGRVQHELLGRSAPEAGCV